MPLKLLSGKLIYRITDGYIYNDITITHYRWHDENISQAKNSKRKLTNSMRTLKVISDNPVLGLGHHHHVALNPKHLARCFLASARIST